MKVLAIRAAFESDFSTKSAITLFLKEESLYIEEEATSKASPSTQMSFENLILEPLPALNLTC
ncbi:LOW QUALITY PROTEIN: hypothetical protein TorRG33x02_101240 [Trema orientale]|uniref:Uncharacterized protein n=1 Tax=Trema orientale TaxID=63057 RepID=A0A2P5F8F4_TREOI|nr:LOW QUALITY PROTEIN: hypothetical protein TorRG33x02_101240 [Trema orientale]